MTKRIAYYFVTLEGGEECVVTGRSKASISRRTGIPLSKIKPVSISGIDDDGIVLVDTPRGIRFGFTSDRFSEDSYLWIVGKRVFLSLVFSIDEGKGNLSALFNSIEEQGYKIAVPTPLGKMRAIITKKGFVPHWEEDVEVWEKPGSGDAE